MNNKDRRTIESILREPLTRHRFVLNNKLRAAQTSENPQPFTLDDLKKFFAGLPGSSADFKQEIANVTEAVETGVAPSTPAFDTPEKQLLWGAAFAFLKLNPDAQKTWKTPIAEPGDLSATPLWQQVIGTKAAYQELLSHAHHIREALRDKDTKYSWGEPGAGFSFNRQKNIIDIDLMQTMIVGFEHARADVYREIGHALLSVTYPKRMQQLSTEMRPLMIKQNKAAAKKGPKLTPEEYKKLQMLSTEWQLRRMMFMAGEENVANRFVANMGLQMLQDYSISLNNTAVTQRAIGLTRLPSDENASEELRRYMNLCNAVQLSFFQNNGLFDNTDSAWFKVGIDPNMVRKSQTLAARADNAKDDGQGVSHPDFEYLRELCGGPKGLEHLQPKQHERLYGWANLQGRIARADQDRKAIIEEIWKLYAEDLIQKILEQANDQIDQQLKEAKDKQKEKGDDQDQDGDDGQDGDDQDGQEQDGEGQGQGKGKGKGKGKGQKGKPQRGQQQGDPQDADDLDDADGEESDGQDGQEKKDKSGKKGDKKDKNKDGKKGDKGDKSDENESGDQDGEKSEGAEGKLGADDKDTVPVEGAGDLPQAKDASDVPGDEVDPSADGADADGEGKDADGDGKDADGDDADQDAKTLEELEDEANADEDADDADDADADADADGEAAGKKNGKKPGKPGKQAGHGDGRSLSDLAKQDWKDYPKRVAELSEHIQRVRKIFKEVQKRQLQRKTTQSRSLDILPENGEIKDRFNMEAHRNLTIKKLTGNVEENDLKRFSKDEDKMIPTEIDIVIMIDGSGSMGTAYGSSGPSPLQSALQASAILYEAAAGKDMKMNVYVGMWGDSNPPIMIKPGDDRITVGKAMEKMRSGMSSGTDFAPAIVKTAETIGEQRGKSGTLSGFTHVLVISDGDMFDVAKSTERMNTMFEYSDKVTFDVAIITAKKGTAMEQMADSIKGRKPHQDMGVVLSSNPNEVPMEIVGLLLDKVRKCGSFTAVPNSQKRRAMKKAHNKMDKKP